MKSSVQMQTSLQGNKAARIRIINIPITLIDNITQKIIVSPSTEVEHGAPWNICLNNGEILAQLATSNVDLNAFNRIPRLSFTTPMPSTI
mmetsp:Transcript_20202/g.42043  ORF Transcript_20202/g.42043 Transcript_20202/m.42043 type:complete len:90 (-) Transcript_20202:193-462(-)